jgi:hypothetical protein
MPISQQQTTASAEPDATIVTKLSPRSAGRLVGIDARTDALIEG